MKPPKTAFGYEDDLYVRRFGDNRELPPLVYLHGLGDSGLCFKEVVDELTENPSWSRRRQLIPDLPGYGRSRTALLALSLEAMADRVAQWLTNRGEERVIVIGHSMGAIVALMLAERHPQLVAGLVDIEGNKTSDDCTLSRLPGTQTLGEFLSTGFKEMTDDILLEEISNKNSPGFVDPAYLRYSQSLQVCSPQAFFEHAHELVYLSVEGRLASRLASLDCPKFFVVGRPWGSGDRSCNIVKLEGIPVSEVHPAGHWLFIEQPDLCAWIIARALTYFSTPLV